MKHAHGFDALDRQFARLAAALPHERKVAAAMKGGAVIRDEARRLAPERSGKLREHISAVEAADVTLQGGSAPTDALAIVGPIGSTPDGDVPYAEEVERGQRYWPGQPYMRPAFAAKRDEAAEAVVFGLRGDVLAALR